MAKKTQSLKPDTVLKNYWDDNTKFADLFNAVLFDGQQVIKPEELVTDDTEESSILEHRDYAESIQASRDNFKICKKSSAHGVAFVLLGMEHQERIHYAMPIRIMGYDYGAYKKQYECNAKKYNTSEGMDENEYLSGMKKTDRFTPVITIVVYYGEKPWDGAVSLHEMLHIPDEMKPFINDYKMLLVEARQNSLTLHNLHNVYFFNMLKILLDRNMSGKEAKEKVIQYAKEHNVDKSVIMTIAGATNCKIDYNAFGKGNGDMCTLFDEIAKESEAKGRIKGRTEGRAFGIIDTSLDLGLSEIDILERLQNKMGLSLQAAQEYMNMFYKQTI